MNSKLLVSSHLFLLNSVYAYNINEISTAVILFMVYVLSTLHHFTNIILYVSIRHTMDICEQFKIHTCILLHNGSKQCHLKL